MFGCRRRRHHHQMRERSVHVSQCVVWCATPALSISCVAHLSGKTGLEWAKERGHHALVAAVEVCMRPIRRAGLIRANRVMGGCSGMRTLPSSSWPRALSLFQSISVSVSVHRGSFNVYDVFCRQRHARELLRLQCFFFCFGFFLLSLLFFLIESSFCFCCVVLMKFCVCARSCADVLLC